MLEDGGSRRKSAEIFAAQVAAENEGHAAFYGFSLSVGLAYALSVFLRVPVAHEEILETFLKRDELIVSGAFVGVHDEERQGADARIILPRQGPGPVDVMKDALGYGIVARFLDDPARSELGVSPAVAPDKATYVTLDFEKGWPVAVNGEKMKASDIIRKLNKLGGDNGIGLLDIVENRLVGMKSRGVYETPGGTILYKAHEVLETLTLDKLTAHKKRELAITFGELVYDGQWFSPLRKALSAFVTSTQEYVTGKVRLELYKGNLINAGVWSPYSLYREDIATFAAGGDYKQSDATGFISIYGLPTKVQAIVNSEKEGK